LSVLPGIKVCAVYFTWYKSVCCLFYQVYSINLTLLNKHHGPINFKKGVTCVHNGHELYATM